MPANPPMTDAEIAALREAAEKATKGEWAQIGKSRQVGVPFMHQPASGNPHFEYHKVICSSFPGQNGRNNAAYVGCANPATILRLLSHIAAVQAERDRAAGALMRLGEVQMKQQAACLTLEKLGYTYNGGMLWRPPLGPDPSPLIRHCDQVTTERDAAREEARVMRDELPSRIATMIGLAFSNIENHPPIPVHEWWIAAVQGEIRAALSRAQPMDGRE